MTISLLAIVVGFGIPSCSVYDSIKDAAIVDLHREPTTATTTTIIVTTASSSATK